MAFDVRSVDWKSHESGSFSPGDRPCKQGEGCTPEITVNVIYIIKEMQNRTSGPNNHNRTNPRLPWSIRAGPLSLRFLAHKNEVAGLESPHPHLITGGQPGSGQLYRPRSPSPPPPPPTTISCFDVLSRPISCNCCPMARLSIPFIQRPWESTASVVNHVRFDSKNITSRKRSGRRSLKATNYSNVDRDTELSNIVTNQMIKQQQGKAVKAAELATRRDSLLVVEAHRGENVNPIIAHAVIG
ncbi:hypothetical protein J6590_083648 [Homalodisca vitripennis]|nr:hypothetical protein J6590_083648 [Homalodisca vitripennis]